MSSEEVAKKKFEHENISLYVKPSPKIEKRAIALYDYQGTDSDDLSIREGEELIVVKHSE